MDLISRSPHQHSSKQWPAATSHAVTLVNHTILLLTNDVVDKSMSYIHPYTLAGRPAAFPCYVGCTGKSWGSEAAWPVWLVRQWPDHFYEK